MMNAQDGIKELLSRMEEKAMLDETTKRLLSEIDKLDKETILLDASTFDEKIRLPYSSMPKITARCWK